MFNYQNQERNCGQPENSESGNPLPFLINWGSFSNREKRLDDVDGIISGTRSRDIIISSCILRCFGDQNLNVLEGGKMMLGQGLFDHGAWEWIVM